MKRPFTVLLEAPEPPGADTLKRLRLARVTEQDTGRAAHRAQIQTAEADDGGARPGEYKVLIVFEGHHESVPGFGIRETPAAR